MATYYVGIGGNDANAGTSWALRKLTLNGAEDIPVAANDTVYVGPGTYRHLLTVDVSGSSGNPITYIGDTTGEHTDGVGGIVRVTGSDNDTTATRASAVTATSKDYRTFRGFTFDMSTGILFSLVTACSNWIIEDCYFGGIGATQSVLSFSGTGTTNTVRRCVFMGARLNAILFVHASNVDNAAHVVENCLFIGMNGGAALRSDRVGGITVNHCTSVGAGQFIRIGVALTAAQTITVNNCIVAYNGTGFIATASGEITENYNALWGNAADRSNTSTGGNSVAYPPMFAAPLLLSGIGYPWNVFDLASWSPLRAIAGTSMSSDELHGLARPATDSKKSWGMSQFVDTSRETTTVRTGSASIKLADAGRHQMFVPTTATSTTISVYVQWEADYAGTKPSLVVKQPGQSDSTDTATGSSGSWEQLSVTLTPAASPGYVVVELVSSNTATSGAYDTFFDDLVVS